MRRRLNYRRDRNSEAYLFLFDPASIGDVAIVGGVITSMGLSSEYDLTCEEAGDLLNIVEGMFCEAKGIQQ